MSQKGFVPILITVLIAVALGGYFIYQNQTKSISSITKQTPKPSPSPVIYESTSSAETANWKTYTNERHGFEIKYPPDWLADEFYNISSEEVIPFLLSIGRKKPAAKTLVLGL